LGAADLFKITPDVQFVWLGQASSGQTFGYPAVFHNARNTDPLDPTNNPAFMFKTSSDELFPMTFKNNTGVIWYYQWSNLSKRCTFNTAAGVAGGYEIKINKGDLNLTTSESGKNVLLNGVRAMPLTGGASRPETASNYQMFFDTSITPPRPIWYYSASGWVDATGSLV